MGLSNIIEEFLKELIEEENGHVEIKRNELAGKFNCVPSQINYVISTRFSPERGYKVESRRGGGGYIRITQVGYDEEGYVIKLIRLIGDCISFQGAEALIKNLYENNLIDKFAANLVLTAVSDNSLIIGQPQRDMVRAKIMKNILLKICE